MILCARREWKQDLFAMITSPAVEKFSDGMLVAGVHRISLAKADSHGNCPRIFSQYFKMSPCGTYTKLAVVKKYYKYLFVKKRKSVRNVSEQVV